jgi:putative tryptophan/tyrosine transport system substrate-binding protein
VRRRDVVLVLTTVAAAPRGAWAQAGKPRRVGLMLATTPAAASHITAAFSEALRGLGYVEGKNVVFEYRWAEGRPERFLTLAADLVGLKVDVIVASSTAAAEAARQATSTIPIVMVNAADPVASGLVASLIKPGGNVTGLSSQLTPDIRAKQLQLLKEATPRLAGVAVLRRAAGADSPVWKEYEAAGQGLGVKVSFFDVKDADDLARVFAAMRRERVGAVLVAGDPMFFTERRRITALAAEHRLPGIFPTREYADAGGLMSYSARLTDQFRRAASYVDKILKGASPARLPVEQPTQFELAINLGTAKVLGLTIPHALLIRADEVIQ